ncbi:MAG: 3-hydroxybenzoate 6-monooxygenase [Rhizobiaceae bacterium]
MKELPVIIAGGGIGGLAIACGLAQKGVRSIVLEMASQLGEIGAGIQIGPNAFHCFDYLGIGEEARAKAVYVDYLRLMDATNGEEIVAISLGENFRKRFQNPYAVVHRADLHGVLLKACRDSKMVEIRASHAVESYEQDEKSVRVFCRNKDPVDGLVLIGADGLRSNVRQQMIGDGEPRISGHATYRSVIPVDKMPEELRWNAATLWAGPKCHIVHYPLKASKVYNLVVTYHNDIEELVAGRAVDKEQVRQGFEHITPRAQQIIEHGEDWKLWVLCDRDPIMNWADGRVALLGDAAHPMMQYLAQGACMAMEDAVCLSHMFGRHEGDVEKALEAYVSNRALRTGRVQMSARLMGDMVFHPDGAEAAIRNDVFSKRSEEEWYNRLEWLYGKSSLSLS